MSKVIIQEQPNGQIMLTLPKKLAEAMQIRKGQTVEWRVGGAQKLELLL